MFDSVHRVAKDGPQLAHGLEVNEKLVGAELPHSIQTPWVVDEALVPILEQSGDQIRHRVFHDPLTAMIGPNPLAHSAVRIDEPDLQRIGEPLEAPRDWVRSSKVRCSCELCSELARFLANPHEERWTLRAAQQIRTHVEDVIRHAPADVDCETVKRGSPHSLVCTKNQASYRRRVAQRKKDATDMAILNPSR